ncbi:ASCH domain-containing protein [Thalassobellus citreus]|uniref:ASCH domain-containing protein n=1 Tax=Thalassobellus citreus TaxID=3367752 RepID=UPI0037A0FFE9
MSAVINFSTNWNNKLDCKCFTTIRLKNSNKYKLNHEYPILLNRKLVKRAEIIDIKTIFFNQIDEYIARLDTGYSAYETKEILKKMYSKVNLETQPFSFILLATI